MNNPFRTGLLVTVVMAVMSVMVACSVENGSIPAAPITGADRDAHGCIGSAGYRWCQHENSCVRPWELAEAKNLALEEDAIEAYCNP